MTYLCADAELCSCELPPGGPVEGEGVRGLLGLESVSCVLSAWLMPDAGADPGRTSMPYLGRACRTPDALQALAGRLCCACVALGAVL